MKTAIKILREARKYWVWLIISVIAILGNSVLGLYLPQVVRKLMFLITDNDPEIVSKSAWLAGSFLFVALLQWLTQFLRTFCTHKAAWSFVHDLRVKLYNHLQKLSMSFFHDKQTGQLMSRILNDTEKMELFIAHAAAEILASAVIFLGVMIMLFTINVTLALVSIAVIPLVAVGVWIYAVKVRPLFKARQQIVAEMSGVLQDNISGIREIQIFNRQAREEAHFSDYSSRFTKYNIMALTRSAFVHPAITFLNQVGTVLVIAVGGVLAAKGVNAGDIVAFILYLSSLYAPINNLARVNEDLQDSLAAGERIFDMLSISTDVPDPENPVELGEIKGDISFNHVDFHYNEGAPVLKDFTLDIKSGETVALVGPTGVGKTTIASLVARFYDPTGGSVRLDGIDLKDMRIRDLHDNISMVLQDVFLFHGTVEENIAYGADNPTHEEIVAAAKIANAHEFISEMEKGYDTIVGERGVRLSGGQKQRISIARAILRDKPVLILDEATAAVDNSTERLIHEAIDKVIENRTTIIIAHRLSTIRNADKIAVIDKGAVCEIGTHDELIARGGMYKRLYFANEEA
ncbi:MAG: ABC transporter ATP-binding protein [Oscillospiraceae bacterium]|nr:ABC transporter ATP-binding protein [Oscillospiraceae bacterium]